MRGYGYNASSRKLQMRLAIRNYMLYVAPWAGGLDTDSGYRR